MLHKGFTLVELLAVIVILGTILAITVPKVVDVVNDSKMSTFKTDAKLVLQKLSSEKTKNTAFDFTNVTLQTLSQNLGIRTTNYGSITVKDIGGVPYINIVGKDKWDGYTAYGVYENINVVQTKKYVENTTAPTVNLVGSASINLTYGSTYTDLGISYSDDVDTVETLANNIIITGEVNTMQYGTYELKYYVYDSTGNVGSVTRIVNVVQSSSNQPISAEILVVAGGGGGGSYVGGGGGGGGVLEKAISLISTSYVITVGAGGSGGTGVRTDNETNGENSSFVGGGYNLVAIGGGRGTRYPNQSGIAGGSGGGAGGCEAGGGLGGAALQTFSASGGFGNKGGDMIGSRPNNDTEGRGGGGAGGPAPNSYCYEPGDGGSGYASSITGTTYYYGGGGGGGGYYTGDYGTARAGNGGRGGGGGGGSFTTGTPGTGGTGGTANGQTPTLNMGASGQGIGGAGGANTGGGGGGCGHSDRGGNGGSGVVVIAYPGTVAKASGGTISTTSRPGYVVHTFTSSGTFTVL